MHASVLTTTASFAAAVGTLTTEDQFKSAGDLLGKDQERPQVAPAIESSTAEATAKAANKEVEKTKRQGVKPAL
jgi:hypothetical protein